MWDDVDKDGSPLTSASHIKTKGSGGKEMYNLLPMCVINGCHGRFEESSGVEKKAFLNAARKFTEKYLEARADKAHDTDTLGEG